MTVTSERDRAADPLPERLLARLVEHLAPREQRRHAHARRAHLEQEQPAAAAAAAASSSHACHAAIAPKVMRGTVPGGTPSARSPRTDARRRRARSRCRSGRRSAAARSACVSQACPYAAASRGVTSRSRSSPVSASTKRTSPSAPGSRSACDVDVHGEDVVPERAQDLQPDVRAVGIEEVGNDHRQPDLPRPRREFLARRAQIGRPAGFHLLELLEHAEDASLAASRRRLVHQAAREGQDRQAIEVRETDVAQRRREPPRQVELRRLRHRAR